MQGSAWERIAAGGARLAWPVARALARTIPSRTFHPAWAPAPAAQEPRALEAAARMAAHDRLALPDLRKRDAAHASSPASRIVASLVDEHVGEIKAHIVERDGQVVMEKTCPSTAPSPTCSRSTRRSSTRIEALFPGRDFPRVTDALHNHGTSSIKYGRGAVLTVDLTNRCNMMCDPCFMDANQVGYVHELTLDDVKQILDDALSIKPRRQMSVQFSGGEPTISPIFLDAVATRARSATSACRPRPTASASPRMPGSRTQASDGRAAHRLPAVRRRQQGGQLAPQGRQPVRREAARDREPARRGHRRHASSSRS